MAPPQSPDLRHALRLGGLPCLWLTIALMMVRNHLGDPYTPELSGTAIYGHNPPGALLQGLIWSFSELVILMAILRPWSYRHSWTRGLGAVAILLPWAGLSVIMTMHAGGIVALHALWIALLLVIMLVVTTVSAIASKRAQDP